MIRWIRHARFEIVAFKVLRVNLTSVGLLGARIMQYQFDIWNVPEEPLSEHPRTGGGLWMAPDIGTARAFQKYAMNKHNIETRIFRCRFGDILHQTSCRIKTDRLIFSAADEIVK